MSENTVEVTDQNFEDMVLKSELPVLVDFWAEWCGPCKAIAPILEEIANEYNDKLIVAKLNIDKNSETPTKYNVRGIPTLLLFKNGEIAATHVGNASKSVLTSFINSNL